MPDATAPGVAAGDREPPTADTWLEPAHDRWALRHVEQSLPTHRVRSATATLRDLPSAADRLPELRVSGSSRGDVTLAEVLDATVTDAWLVLHEGALVDERYFSGMTPETSHLLMSVTKSVVGAVAGILGEQGRLAPEHLVTQHVPELLESGYLGATVRDVLDMRSGVRFREDYTDPTADVRLMEAAIGWRPGVPGAHPGLHSFLAALGADRPHGGPFEYRSCETDVLGWVCERAAGAPMSELITELVWQPMGAQHDAALLCDGLGDAVHDGGLAATARDVARFGQLMLDAGQRDGRPVVPRSWFADIWRADGDVRHAYAASLAEASLPGGWYRSQCWVTPGPHGDLMLCLGIHGQLVRVDPATRTVIVKLSSWRDPQDPARLHDTLLACDSVAGALSGRPGRRGPRSGAILGRDITTGRAARGSG